MNSVAGGGYGVGVCTYKIQIPIQKLDFLWRFEVMGDGLFFSHVGVVHT